MNKPTATSLRLTFKEGSIKLCSLAVLAFLAAIPAIAEDDAAKKDAAQLQGIWEVTVMEGNGNQAPAESFKGMRFLIKGDKLSLSGQAGTLRAFRLNATASPKAIDIFGAANNEFSKGVYKIEGDTLKLCFSQMTKLPRPNDFDTRGTRYMCFTLKRTTEQGGADQPATARESKSEGKDKPKPDSEARSSSR